MKAKDARQYVDGSELSQGCKEMIAAILESGDLERELSAEEEQEIHSVLDVEVTMSNAEIELLDSHMEELRSMKNDIDEALEQAAGELDSFVEQLSLELGTSETGTADMKGE